MVEKYRQDVHMLVCPLMPSEYANNLYFLTFEHTPIGDFALSALSHSHGKDAFELAANATRWSRTSIKSATAQGDSVRLEIIRSLPDWHYRMLEKVAGEVIDTGWDVKFRVFDKVWTLHANAPDYSIASCGALILGRRRFMSSLRKTCRRSFYAHMHIDCMLSQYGQRSVFLEKNGVLGLVGDDIDLAWRMLQDQAPPEAVVDAVSEQTTDDAVRRWICERIGG
jgi:hypothetical protein